MPLSIQGGELLDERYLLIERLGTGGTGEVWRALDHSGRNEVAIKLLHHQHLKAPSVLDRFVREAKILTALQHPNIARAVAWSEQHDPPYMALEYIDGTDLGAWMAERAKAGQKTTVDVVDGIAQQLFDALEYAHDEGVVHRDLKPANIMVRKGSGALDIKIVDFGIAKILEGEGSDSTTSGRTLGTFTYLAPEQLDASGADHRADVFALGTVLFELLTLHRAWLRDMADRPIHCTEVALRSAPMNTPVEVMRRILTGSRPLVSLSRRELNDYFDDVVKRAITVRRSDRFQNIGAMRDAWNKAIIAAAPGRIVRRRETAHTPSTKATEVIVADLPPVMPQTMVIQAGSTSVWTREATDKTPRDGTQEIPGAKTNTDPVRVFPEELSEVGGGSEQPTQPPKSISQPPRPGPVLGRALEAPAQAASVSLPLVTPAPGFSGQSNVARSGRRFDIIIGSLILSATLLVISYLALNRRTEPLEVPSTPLQAAPAAPPPEPTVVPAAVPKEAEPEAPSPAPALERPRRRAAPPKLSSPAAPAQVAPATAPRHPLWDDLERLEAHPEDAEGRLNLGEQLRAEALKLPREQATMLQTCVSQTHLAATNEAALAKLRTCVERLQVYSRR